jgi:hypothetical protein
LNAYKVFETLNGRGVKLSTPDLLKNYIFSVVTQNNDVTEEDLNDLDNTWAQIVEQLGDNDFTDFVRYYQNSTNAFVQKKYLFKEVRNQHTTAAQAYSYLTELTRMAPTYASLFSPHEEWWVRRDNYRDATQYLEGLNLFGIRQPFSVLMMAYDKFTPEEFVKSLRYMHTLSLRYLVCGLSPNEQEKRYSNMAIQISKGNFSRASHIKNSQDFKYLYPSDEMFVNAFKVWKMPSRQSSKKIRYVLAALENFLGGSANYVDIQLEHICPYNPNDVWQQEFGAGIHDVYDRLGNMVLLSMDDLGRESFEKKVEYYRTTNYKLAQKVATYDSWNLENLNHYQEWLGHQAARVWRVD